MNKVYSSAMRTENKAFESSASGKVSPVAVVGARGYAGVELLRWLCHHPVALPVAAFATQEFALHDYLIDPPFMRSSPMAELLPVIESKSVETVFLATPNEVSMQLAPQLMEAGCNVIDLSGAFRLQQNDKQTSEELYNRWYGLSHTQTKWIAQAQYGLMPFAHDDVSGLNKHYLIANPGCYAAASLLALLPLLRAGLLDAQSLVIDGKSGSTGAGKKAEERLLHAEISGNCLAYKAGDHQHTPEIAQAIQSATGEKNAEFFFTPHLLDIKRGMVISIYAKLTARVAELQRDIVERKIEEAYAQAYEKDPLIEWGGEKKNYLLNLSRVVGTPRTQIQYKLGKSNQNQIYLFCLIDNLLKGAATQAIENMNRMLQLPSHTGLIEGEKKL